MLTDQIQDSLNRQMNHEFYSAYLYLSMAAYFKTCNLDGFRHWTKLQAQEELEHAQKIYNYMEEAGGHIALDSIKAPPKEWGSPIAAMEDALNHERSMSKLINELVNLAIEEKDHGTHIFLQWFVTEQIEEENSVEGIVQNLKFIKDAPGAMFMIDRELNARKLETVE